MGIFSKPKPPKPQPIVRMPDENDPAALKARRDLMMQAQAQGGRASTIFQQAADGALGSVPATLQ